MLESLNPSSVFSYFEEILKIPRTSGHEEAICQYLVDFADDHELAYIHDEYDNVIIYKAGSEGYETNAPVILQGHMDMITSHNDDVVFDFLKDPIEPVIDDGFIKAKGTTLGADDGIAVAYMLAILDADELSHPPLECVFTSSEETDMSGAANLDVSNLKGNLLINIDHQRENEIIIGGAGGISLKSFIPLSFATQSGILYRVSFDGLASGHSGFDIIKERANAIKLLGRFYNHLHKRINYSIAKVKGGSNDCLIPNFAHTDLVVDPKDRDAFVYAVQSFNLILKNEYKESEPSLNISFEYKGEVEDKEVLDKTSQKNLRFFLLQLPNGIRKMSRERPNMIQTSLNAGTLRMRTDEIEVSHLIRSMVSSEAKAYVESIGVLCEFLDGYVSIIGETPVWSENHDSFLLNIIEPVYEETFGKKAEITCMHAMPECGIFAEKIKNLDAVSIGPDIIDAHSPNERISIESVERIWEFLINILKKL